MFESPIRVDHPWSIAIATCAFSAAMFWCCRQFRRASGRPYEWLLRLLRYEVGDHPKTDFDRLARISFFGVGVLFSLMAVFMFLVATGVVKNRAPEPLTRAKIEQAIDGLRDETGRDGVNADDVERAIKEVKKGRSAADIVKELRNKNR